MFEAIKLDQKHLTVHSELQYLLCARGITNYLKLGQLTAGWNCEMMKDASLYNIGDNYVFHIL
jgi:hypothetical protein